ncbi:MAG: HlyC/CorC family transporter [Candidatus Aenigmarchaeota archaeon]|nr:HlyC/CorC family transporter [Candidatus Aenigmarchaeota archaeon]
MDIVYQFVLLAVLIVLSAFFSASEIALLSLGRINLHRMVKEKTKNSELISKLLEDPNRLLITILIGNNLVNVSASALATSIGIFLFGSLGIGIAVGVMTFLILLFGEILPKSYAIHNKEKFATFSSGPIYFMQRVQSPLIKLMAYILNKFMDYYGLSDVEKTLVTEEEVKSAVIVGMQDGAIDPEEKEMIHNVFEFDDTEVQEVMVARTNMRCLEKSKSMADVLKFLDETNFSRIPVYEENRDKVIGILYAKDLLKYVGKDIDSVVLEKIVKPALFVPETKKIDELLKVFKSKKVHMAIVVDEYGGVAGLVTLEDLLEELVGEIYDETDVSKNMIRKIDKKTFLVDGETEIEDVENRLKVKLAFDDSDFDTISGLVLHVLGRVPVEGEDVIFDKMSIHVEKMDRQKIVSLKAVKK